MRSRADAARFAEKFFEYGGEIESLLGKSQLSKGSKWHMGKQEIRLLLDFIYEGEPTTADDFMVFVDKRNKRKW